MAADHSAATRVSVTMKLHAVQEAGPFCANQRQVARIVQGGNSAASMTSRCAIALSMTPQRVPVHCAHPEVWQRPANRIRASGAPCWAAAFRKSASTVSAVRRLWMRPSGPRIPSNVLPGAAGALGQDRGSASGAAGSPPRALTSRLLPSGRRDQESFRHPEGLQSLCVRSIPTNPAGIW